MDRSISDHGTLPTKIAFSELSKKTLIPLKGDIRNRIYVQYNKN